MLPSDSGELAIMVLTAIDVCALFRLMVRLFLVMESILYFHFTFHTELDTDL